MSIPQPIQSILPNPVFSPDLRNGIGSYLWAPVINQGASTGPQSANRVILDRGIYRISGSILSTNFVGPAASSASIKCARIALFEPNQNFASDIAHTPLEPSVPHQAFFDLTIQLLTKGWLLSVETFVTTGVGQSIGVEAAVYISKLT